MKRRKPKPFCPEYKVPFEEIEGIEFELTMAKIALHDSILDASEVSPLISVSKKEFKDAQKRINQALKELINIYHTREIPTTF